MIKRWSGRHDQDSPESVGVEEGGGGEEKRSEKGRLKREKFQKEKPRKRERQKWQKVEEKEERRGEREEGPGKKGASKSASRRLWGGTGDARNQLVTKYRVQLSYRCSIIISINGVHCIWLINMIVNNIQYLLINSLLYSPHSIIYLYSPLL